MLIGKDILSKLYLQSDEALKRLKYFARAGGKRLKLYGAGKKFNGTSDYFRVFPRDSFTSAFLLKDPGFLKDLLTFCIWQQGRKNDPLTGEEPGKIPHEWPGVALRGKNTLYASVDSTPLFLINFGVYWDWTKDKRFIKQNKKSIEKALDYVTRHIKRGLFWDDPAYCRARKYGLWSGCWRDGGYPERKFREHSYPASYFMVNIFLVSALRSLANFADSGIAFKQEARHLQQLADEIKAATLNRFWLPQKEYFASAIDQDGIIDTLYLDSVWPLYFFEESDLPTNKIKGIFRKIEKLATPFGYLTRERFSGYNYEGNKMRIAPAIWPVEHAYLALAAEKYGVSGILKKALSPLKLLAKSKYPFSEYISFEKNKPVPAGCNIQLWTVAYIKAMYDLYLK